MAIDVELLENKTPEQYTQQVNDDLLENTLSKDYLIGIEEADDEIAQIKLSLDDDGSSFDEEENILTSLIELSEGLESIHEFLSVNTNGPTADAMRFAEVALEAYSKKTSVSVGVPDYAGLGSTIMRRDYRTLAMESIGEKIKDVVKKVIEAVKNATTVFMRYATKFFSYFASHRRKLKLLRAQAVRIKEAKITVVSKRIDLPPTLSHSFQVDGKTVNRPADIVKAGGGLATMMTKFSDSNIAYLDKVIELVDKYTKTGVYNTAEAAMNVGQVLRHTFSGTDVDFHESTSLITVTVRHIPGNRKIFVSANKQTTNEFDDYVRNLGAISTSVDQDTDPAPTKSLEVMTPEEIIVTIDGCLKMLDVMDSYEKRAKQIMAARDKIINKFGVRNTYSDVHTTLAKNDFTSLLVGISKYIRNIMKFGSILLSTTTKIVKDVTSFAALSLKEYHAA